MLNHGKQVAIVVLNWNSWYDTVECLESVLQLKHSNYRIFVVDNKSTNDSLEKIKDWARGVLPVESKFLEYDKTNKPLRVFECDVNSSINLAESDFWSEYDMFLIKNDSNAGFSAGYNVGIRFALEMPDVEYVMVVNNDTVIAKDALEHLLNVMSTDTNCGMAGGKIYYYNEPKRIWYGGGKISWIYGGGRYIHRDVIEDETLAKNEEPTLVPFLTGCFWFIKRSAIAKVGLLPEEYFMGGEEYEYSHRMKLAGYNLRYVPYCKIWHKVGRSHDVQAGENNNTSVNNERVDRNSSSYAYKSPKYVYNWYRYKLLFQKRNLSYSIYLLWYALFWVYTQMAIYMHPNRIGHVDPILLKFTFQKALEDHSQYDKITLEQLINFEQEFRKKCG